MSPNEPELSTRIRTATRDDLSAIAELFSSVEEAILHRPSRLDADAVEGWLNLDSAGTKTWLMEDDDVLVAAGFARVHGDRGSAAGAVRPSSQGRGLGGRLIELSEESVGREGAKRVHAWSLAGDEAADALFVERGYREVRRFWEMTIELKGDIPEPDIEIEPFAEKDARAFHAALEEAFSEHWEHEAESFDEWWSRQTTFSGFDPSLWFIVKDGNEIAAAIRNDANRMSSGFIGALGVRPSWRGRGYGRALLQQSFREFQRRGIDRATLGVDASNETGATALYESVGMHVDLENILWEKVLG